VIWLRPRSSEMPQIRPSVPGIERLFGLAPQHDAGQMLASDVGAPLQPNPVWTPSDLVAFQHRVNVSIPSGSLRVYCIDLSLPYYDMALECRRMLDVTEQHVQRSVLRMHPNTDPVFHFFGNWQLAQEATISSAWNHTFAELQVGEGHGDAAFYYREEPLFRTNSPDGASMQATLLSFGVPNCTLRDLAWQFAPANDILRARQRDFSVVAGKHVPGTTVDVPDCRMWRFFPVRGSARRYTSRYFYRDFMDRDGMREVSFPSLVDLELDALGHRIRLAPVEAAPPFRTYVMADDSGRELALEMQAFATYLDGDLPGRQVKTLFASRLVDRTKERDNEISYEYNDGMLVGATYPTSGPQRTVHYSYDEEGQLIGITDEAGHRFQFEYVEDLLDSDERLEPRSKISRIIDPEGNSVLYEYDHPRRQVKVTFLSAAGQQDTIVFHYQEDDGTGQRYIVEELIDVRRGESAPQPVRTQYLYSADGRFNVVGRIDPLGNTFRKEYNNFNQITAAINSVGHRREYEYDVRQAPVPNQPHRYDLVRIHETNVDAAGAISVIVRQATYTRYDAASGGSAGDESHSTHRPATFNNPLGALYRYLYEDAGQGRPTGPTTVIDPLGHPVHYAYDNRGAITEIVDALNQRTEYFYNPHGQLIRVRDANGRQRHWLYDPAADWLVAETDALGAAPGDPGHSVIYDRDERGRTVRQRDAAGDIVNYAYNGNRRLQTITQQDAGAALITRLEYDSQGRLVAIEDPAGKKTVFRYDEAGRLYESLREALPAETLRFGYDAAGRLVRFTDRNGAVTTYLYDALGQLIQTQEPAWPVPGGGNPGKIVRYTYDRLGQRLTATDSQLPGPMRYNYDAASNLVARTDGFGTTLRFTYNANGGLVRIQDDRGILDLNYVLDAVGRVMTVTDSAHLEAAQSFQYNYTDGALVNNLYHISVPGIGLESRFRYDANDLLTSIRHLHQGALLRQFEYARRADGLISHFAGDRAGSLTYDGRKQLMMENDVGLGSAYDAAGNRLWRAAAAPPADQFQTYDRADRLQSAPLLDAEFMSNPNGSMIRRRRIATGEEIHYVFDGTDRLMQVLHGNLTIDYLYDCDGLLVERRRTDPNGIEVRRVHHAGQAILLEVDDAGALLELYTRDPGGTLLRRRQPRAVPATGGSHSLYYLHDGLDNVIALADSTGVIRAQITIDSWGNETVVDPDQLAGAFGFGGAYRDRDTRLVHFGVRWYAPELGRWMSEDPLLATLAGAGEHLLPAVRDLVNLLRYCDNDPVNLSDPSGLGKGKLIIRVVNWIQTGAGNLAPIGRRGIVGRGTAIRIRQAGGDVAIQGGRERSRRALARQIEETAHPDGVTLHHTQHSRTPHFQTQGVAGHTFYGITGWLTAQHWLGDTWYSEVIDFVNPASLPRDVLDLYYAFSGEE
jgi:RHS repeat-associated protein